MMDEHDIEFAFVTFRSMDAVSLVLKAYDIPWWKLKLGLTGDQIEFRSKHIFKELPTISRARNPDNIQWQNIGYTDMQRLTRSIIMWIVAIVFTSLCMAGMIMFKNRS